MSGLKRVDLSTEYEGMLAEKLADLTLTHAARAFVLVPSVPPHGPLPAVQLGGDPVALVTELLRLARLGAHVEAEAHAYPHKKVRTVVRQAAGARPC